MISFSLPAPLLFILVSEFVSDDWGGVGVAQKWQDK